VQDHSAAQAVLLPVKLAAPTVKEEATPRSTMSAGVIEIDSGAALVRLRGSVATAWYSYFHSPLTLM
jgi:hypothetical protein